MLKNKKALILLSTIFLLIEIQLSYLIQTIVPSNSIQFSAVVLACVFCFLFIEKSKSYFFTQLALLCTLCADYFLVLITPKNQLLGMIFFVGTQITYFLRILFEQENIKIRKIHIILRAASSIIVIVAICVILKEQTDALALVSIFYYANLILNIVFSFVNFKNSQILAIGLVCFAVCDTFIGLANMGAYVNLSESSLTYKLLHLNFDITWAFYVPSQTLLAISLLPKRIKKRV